jgi:GTP-binding protein
MIIKSIEFIKSSTSEKQCPTTGLPEFAFVGRSNVGKSSLINFLTGKKNIAKTSSTPGKTRLINHFLINNEWYIVDLPGYGYAKVSKKEKEKIDRIINDYILRRTRMLCLFVLVDSRHEPQNNDIQFINQLGIHHVPLAIVFTKTDKLNQQELKKNIRHFTEALKRTWEEVPDYFFTSVKDRKGREELLGYIEAVIKGE